MHRTLFLLMITVAFVACKNDKTTDNTTQAASPTTQSSLNTLSYPSVPEELVVNIGTKGDHIDVIFYNMPISISRDGNDDVQQMLSHVSQQPPTQVAVCNPIGRIFFQGQGETLAEADLYLGENCNYYLFMVDGKPTYANALLPEGTKFFENIIGPYRK